MFWIATGIIVAALIVWLTIDYIGWEMLLEWKWPQLVQRER